VNPDGSWSLDDGADREVQYKIGRRACRCYCSRPKSSSDDEVVEVVEERQEKDDVARGGASRNEVDSKRCHPASRICRPLSKAVKKISFQTGQSNSGMSNGTLKLKLMITSSGI